MVTWARKDVEAIAHHTKQTAGAKENEQGQDEIKQTRINKMETCGGRQEKQARNNCDMEGGEDLRKSQERENGE